MNQQRREQSPRQGNNDYHRSPANRGDNFPSHTGGLMQLLPGQLFWQSQNILITSKNNRNRDKDLRQDLSRP